MLALVSGSLRESGGSVFLLLEEALVDSGMLALAQLLPKRILIVERMLLRLVVLCVKVFASLFNHFIT